MRTNNLDLNAYAVEELNEVETLEVEGGGIPGWFIALAITQAISIYDNWDKISAAYNDGYNSVN